MASQITVTDFHNVRWLEVLQECERGECSCYCTQLYRKAREAAEGEDQVAHRVLTLLADVTSLIFKLDSRDEPLGPMMVMRDRRSAILTDFTDDDLDLLAAVVSTIEDPELQARVADVLWLRRHDHRMAMLAVDAYLATAALLEDPRMWPPFAERVERALQLAASLGRKNPAFPEVISYIQATLDRYQGSDPLFLSAKLMELLLERKAGSRTEYALWATEAAERAELEHNWHKARVYWDIAARWYAQEENEEPRRAARLRVALAYVGECDDALSLNPPSYIAACSFLQEAIEALRRLGGEENRVEQLHRRLLQLEPKQTENMERVSVSVNVGAEVEQARARVHGKTLHEALFTLALSVRPPSVAQLRDTVEKYSQQYLFVQLVSPAIINDEGKVIARKPALLAGDTNEVEESLQAEMFEEARRYQQIHAQARIEPARHQISLEHNIRERDILPLVIDNPFVPPGREPLYVKGLHAGLIGDFAVAAHLLVPQIENSIRTVLARHGAITSGLSSGGIQEEFDLAKLLSLGEAVAVFGEDRVFDLRGLLVERHGSNLRNRLAHGLVSFDDLLSLEVSYLWWMSLNLCCLPIMAQLQGPKAANSDQPPSQDAPDGPEVGR